MKYMLPGMALIFIAPAALAQDASSNDGSLSAKQYVIDLGVGAMYKPKYPGADAYQVYPFPLIRFSRFYIPILDTSIDGDAPKSGFSIYPSFDFNGKRNSSDSAELKGTRDVDWALELGLGVSYQYDWMRGFVELRQGINGHTGQVADFGIDMITNPTERLGIVFGPRLSWGSSDYMDTYFGVTAAEAAVNGSVLSPYDAGSGFKSFGMVARANYGLTDNTTLHLQAGWDRLIGDAADSPIAKVGSENQLSIGAGISYKFAFDIFE
jgi:outer membrane protein